MKTLKNLLLVLSVILMQLVQTGCTKEDSSTNPPGTTIDSTASKIKSDQAYIMVENEMSKMINGNYSKPSDYDQLKFQSALALYNEAISLNPNNTDAQFGAAFTNIFAAYADTAINNLIKDLDSTTNSVQPNSALFTKLISTTPLPVTTDKMGFSSVAAAGGLVYSITNALKDPPTISRMQKVLRDNFLPKIQAAIDNLTKIEANESFKFIITGKMQGDPALKAVTIYPTEAALMNAMMNFLKFNLQSMLIYKFDLTDYKQASLLAALNQSSTSFFYIASDGTAQAAGAKASFSNGIAKLRKAIDFLERISGTKGDAIIKLGANGIRQADLDTLKTYLTKIESSLTSEISLELRDADTDGNTYTIKVKLGTWLDNPPANPKALLPPYSVVASGTNGVDIKFNAATYADFNFPDPTMGGVFPGMSNETLKRIMKIDKDFAFRLDGWIQLQPFMYGYAPMGVQGLTVKLYTASKTYTAVTDYWGNYELFVRDAGAVAQPVTKFSIMFNGEEIELQNVSTNYFDGVLAKRHLYAPINLTMKPQNLTASKQFSPAGIILNWSVPVSSTYYDWYYAYKIQRKVTSGGQFSDIQINNYSNYLSAVDQNVNTGINYTYRVRTLAPAEGTFWNYGDLLLVTKNVYYSNEVSITP